jgi:hypothetical protein
LLELAGKETPISKQYRLYIDVVKRAILFLPQRPTFHPINLGLKNFNVEVLDITDVVLSKLKRFNSDDSNDIRAMVDRGLLNHPLLIQRFSAAADWFSIDARATEVPKYLKRLHTVERDFLALPPSQIELPAECEED